MEEKIKPVPIEVSPLIKLFRWSCLFAGVIHGFKLQRKYHAIEEARREQEERERPEREEFLAREKERRNAAELREIEEIFLGTVFTDKEVTVNQETPDTSEIIINENETETLGDE